MALSRLSLTDFRSYADALIAPGPGLVVLTGENGAGKTNVLEAVSLLSPGRGLRGASLSEMARTRGSGIFAVAGRLSSPLPFKGGDQGVGGARAGSMPARALVGTWVVPTPYPSPEEEGLKLGANSHAASPANSA
jgi:DNA replication and repair protein RecF